MTQPPIGDYALLADGTSTALVSRGGGVDWACLRRPDAGSAFARLLDWERGGHWDLVVRDGEVSDRRYLDGGLVLRSEVRGPRGRARVTEAMPSATSTRA